jgi:hypothetical protein
MLPSTDPIWLEPVVNFFAVLLGASLAWGTSYFFEARKEKQIQVEIAYSIFFKISLFLDDVAKMLAHVQATEKRAKEIGFDGPIWQIINNIAGMPESREGFDSKELALLTSHGEIEIAMKLRELENGHKIIISAFQSLISMKGRVGGVDLQANVSGKTVNYILSPADHAKLAPLLIDLKDLSQILSEQSQESFKIGKIVAIEFCKAARKTLQIKKFPMAEFDDSIFQ